jgi:hypothetical protein
MRWKQNNSVSSKTDSGTRHAISEHATQDAMSFWQVDEAGLVFKLLPQSKLQSVALWGNFRRNEESK